MKVAGLPATVEVIFENLVNNDCLSVPFISVQTQ